MAALPKLKVVGRHGAGLTSWTFRGDTARRGGGPRPGSNAQAVAEMRYAYARLREAHVAHRQGDARGRLAARGGGNTELHGKTLGIVGSEHRPRSRSSRARSA